MGTPLTSHAPTDVLVLLDRAHRMGCSDPNDPSRRTIYADAADEIRAARERLAAVEFVAQQALDVTPGTVSEALNAGNDGPFVAEAVLIAMRGNGGACPSACDDDCDTDCHEAHQVSAKRAHAVEDCPAVRASATDGAAGGEAQGSLTPVIDAAFLHDLRTWSEATFGPKSHRGPLGPLAHLRKEVTEVAADPFDLEEWVDVAILALDGAWRAGHTAEQVLAAIHAKHATNQARTWPDWRTAPADEAIEHIRDDSDLVTVERTCITCDTTWTLDSPADCPVCGEDGVIVRARREAR